MGCIQYMYEYVIAITLAVIVAMIYEIYMRYTGLLSQKNKTINFMYTASFTNPAFHTPCVAPTAQGLAHPAPFFPRRGGKRERARANKPKWPGPLFLFSSSPFPFFPIVRCSQLVCARYLVVEPSWRPEGTF
ncbi:hypothetical protein V8C43DRAFT_299860 [Trichoderma afarasin]